MRARFALSVAIVVVGAVLFLADRVGGGGPFASTYPSSERTILPAATAGPLSTPTIILVSLPGAQPTTLPAPSATLSPPPTSTPLPTPRTVPTRVETPPGPLPTLVASRTEGVSIEELWTGLVGFSGKSNQERERYVAEHLFPGAGLAEVRKQSVPYGGLWGPEYGNWDGLSNVIAIRQGTLPAASRKLIVLGAHFDKVTYPRRSSAGGRSDGILDNGSGVNLIAKVAQSLRSPFNDLEIVAFATEEPEPHFYGSRIYFGNTSSRQRTVLFANFDCLGIGNLALIDGAADPQLGKMALQVATGEGLPLVWRVADAEVASDHVIAQYYGLRVLSFTSDICDWPKTHNPADNLSVINKDAYYRQYLASLKILAYLDAYLAGISAR